MLKTVMASLTLLALSGTVNADMSSLPNVTKDLSVEQRHITSLIAPQSDLKVTAWVDHDDNTYQFGEDVILNVKTNQDAYITLLDIGTSGKIHIIFPNKYQQDNFLKAGQVVQVPSKNAPFSIKVSAPAGKEVIKVIATTKAKALIEDSQTVKAGPYKAIKKSAQSLSKDLTVELKDRRQQGEKWAEYTKVITIVENNDFVVNGVQPAESEPLLAMGGKYAHNNLPLEITTPNLFKLHLRSDKQQYNVGDEVTLFVTAEQNCQLTVFDIGSSGKVTMLLPNRYQQDNFIRGGQTIQIPSDIAKEHYLAKAPTGTDHIVATCNKQGENLYTGHLNFQTNPYPYWGKLKDIKQEIKPYLTASPTGKHVLAHQTLPMQVIN
jgi:hypothetical protein